MPKKTLIILLSAIILVTFGCSAPPTEADVPPLEPYLSRSGVSLQNFRLPAGGVEFNGLYLSPQGDRIMAVSPTNGFYAVDENGKILFQRSYFKLPLGLKVNWAHKQFLVAEEKGVSVLSTDTGTTLWKTSFETAVIDFDLSPGGNFWAVLTEKGQGEHNLFLYNNSGTQVSQFAGAFSRVEVCDDGSLLLSYKNDSDGMFYTMGIPVEKESWEVSGRLLAVGKEGESAVDQGNRVVLLDKAGQQLALLPLEEVTQVKFAHSGSYMIAYRGNSGGPNLHAYNLNGDSLWHSQVAQGGEIAISGDGSLVVSASWQGYSEDITQVKVFDRFGLEVNSIQVSSRVLKIALDQAGKNLAMAADDGSIFTVDPRQPALETDFPGEAGSGLAYRPVLYQRQDERRPLTLFFLDQQGENLVPVTRFVSERGDALQTAMDELIQGPLQGSGLSRSVAKNASIEVAGLENGILTLEVPEEFVTEQPAENLLKAIIFTASQFKTVTEVVFTSPELDQDNFRPADLEAQENPLLPGEENVIFRPLLSGEQFYLLPQKVAKTADTPEALATDLMQRLEQAAGGFLPLDFHVDTISLSGRQIIVTLAAPLPEDELVPKELIIDAITLSLGINLPVDRVRIQSGGDIISDQGINTPFYINPEGERQDYRS